MDVIRLCSVPNTTPLDPILTQQVSFDLITRCFRKIHFNIIFQSVHTFHESFLVFFSSFPFLPSDKYKFRCSRCIYFSFLQFETLY
jgi:predicted AAA+ superfamily ATPase